MRSVSFRSAECMTPQRGSSARRDEARRLDDERVAVEAARRIAHRAARRAGRRRRLAQVDHAPAVHELMVDDDGVAVALDLERLVDVDPEAHGARGVAVDRGVVLDRDRTRRAAARLRPSARRCNARRRTSSSPRRLRSIRVCAAGTAVVAGVAPNNVEERSTLPSSKCASRTRAAGRVLARLAARDSDVLAGARTSAASGRCAPARCATPSRSARSLPCRRRRRRAGRRTSAD